MKKVLLIIGGKSTGLEIRETVDRYYGGTFDEVYNVISDTDEACRYSYIRDSGVLLLNDSNNDLNYIVSMSDHKLRIKFQTFFQENKINPFSVIHPKSEIAASAAIGKNVYIAAGVVVSSFAKVEDNVMINFGAIIGHDSVIGKNAILSPGCKIGGAAVIGENTLIGAGSFIKQEVTIGKNTFIDAMCYIENNIDENKMCRAKVEIKAYKNIFLCWKM